MKRIIFICRRNRFRSQIAKGLYNHLVKDGSCSESYGVAVLPEEEGVVFSNLPRVANTVEALSKHGIDISNEFCKQLKPELLIDADRIIVLTKKSDLPEWFLSYPYEYWETIDYPGTPTLEESEETIQILKEKILNL